MTTVNTRTKKEGNKTKRDDFFQCITKCVCKLLTVQHFFCYIFLVCCTAWSLCKLLYLLFPCSHSLSFSLYSTTEKKLVIIVQLSIDLISFVRFLNTLCFVTDVGVTGKDEEEETVCELIIHWHRQAVMRVHCHCMCWPRLGALKAHRTTTTTSALPKTAVFSFLFSFSLQTLEFMPATVDSRRRHYSISICTLKCAFLIESSGCTTFVLSPRNINSGRSNNSSGSGNYFFFFVSQQHCLLMAYSVLTSIN